MTDEERGALQDPGLPGACRRATASIRTTCAAPTRSRSWSARAPSPAAAACCSARRSPSGSRPCARCPRASTSAAPAAIPDWTGPDDLEIKIQELREITDWEKPIYVKVGATRARITTWRWRSRPAPMWSCSTACRAAPAATQDVFIEHVGIPTLPAVRLAVEALQELDMHRKVQLIVSGGIRSGADVAKALALGADAVSIGTAALIALGCNDPHLRGGLRSARHHAPASATTAIPAAARPASPPRTRSSQAPDAGQAARRVRNYLDRADAGGADARARLRQVARAQPRARGPGRADRRGGGDGAACRSPAPTGFRARTGSY